MSLISIGRNAFRILKVSELMFSAMVGTYKNLKCKPICVSLYLVYFRKELCLFGKDKTGLNHSLITQLMKGRL